MKSFYKHILLALLSAALLTPSVAQTQRALLVGINTYQADTDRDTTWPDLRGAVNDVEAMHEVLVRKYGFEAKGVRLLTDGNATREGILGAVRSFLIEPSQDGDAILFYYSGHGSQVKNSLSREADGLDESIVPADANDIRDKELRALFLDALDRGVKVTLIFDSCHSGSVTRGLTRPGLTRSIAPDLRDVADASRLPRLEDRGALIFSAAQDDELATEIETIDGLAHGVFSWALLKALSTLPAHSSAERIFLRTRALIKAEGYAQEPVLAGPRSHTLFGSPARPGPEKVIATVQGIEGDTVVVQGGLAIGLRAGAELIRDRDDAGGEAVRLLITDEDGVTRSRATVTDGAIDTIEPGDLFEVDRWAAAERPPLTVWWPPSTLDEAEIDRVAQSLRTIDQATWVEDPTRVFPSHVISWTGSTWLLETPDGPAADLGQNPSVERVRSLLAKASNEKPRVFLYLPPPVALAASLRESIQPFEGVVGVVEDRNRAQYFLSGSLGEDGVKYAWISPAATHASAYHVLPPASARIGVLNTALGARIAADRLANLALTLARIRGWMTLESPPDTGEFPFRLALRDSRSDALIRDGEVVLPGTRNSFPYELVLVRDSDQPDEDIQRRFVYAFSINSAGESQLLFPAARSGTVENRLPVRRTGESAYPRETVLARFNTGPPFGVDTFILLTTEEALPDPGALAFNGVRPPAPTRGDEGTALSELLEELGTVTRGIRRKGMTTPLSWSIERLTVQSAPSQD